MPVGPEQRSGRSQGRATHIALLRGINVGRARLVAMSDLRAVFESLGYTSVRTLLRSGNVVFLAPDTESPALAAAIERAHESELGMSIGVVIRTAAELDAVVAANPIPAAASQGANLHVLFLAEPLSSEARTLIEAADYPPDEARCAEREIYVWYRRGMAGSKTADLLGRRLRSMGSGAVTDRNWNTVSKLVAMTRVP